MWHVDDIKASHHDPQVISNYIEWLHETYEHIFEDGSGALKISCGPVHEYLGMQLDFFYCWQSQAHHGPLYQGHACQVL